jgi:hypothetical protein
MTLSEYMLPFIHPLVNLRLVLGRFQPALNDHKKKPLETSEHQPDIGVWQFDY